MPRATTLSLTWMLIVAACGAEPAPVQDVGVRVEVGSNGVAIRSTYSLADYQPRTDQGRERLRYQLLDSTGAVLDEGTFSDPRAVRSEGDFDGDGEMDDYHGMTAFGIGDLRLREVSGTLVVTDFDQALGAEIELGRVEYIPPTRTTARGARTARDEATICDIIPEEGLRSCNQQTLFDGDPDDDASADAEFLIVGMGFADEGAGQAQAQALVDEMFGFRDYRDHKESFDVRYIELVSLADDGGVTEPGEAPGNPFGLTFGSDRHHVLGRSDDGARLMDQIRTITGAEVVGIMVNSNQYIGVAWFTSNVFVINTPSDTAAMTMAHELGHALFGLRDEYNGSACPNYGESPNISYDSGEIPWSDMLTSSEEVSLEDQLELDPSERAALLAAASAGEVGIYEGAGNCEHGVYRSAYGCRMRSNLEEDQNFFCAVCRKAMDDAIEEFSDDNNCPAWWYDDGHCDTCLGNDSDCCSRRRYLVFSETYTCDDGVGCGDGVCDDGEAELCPLDCSVVTNICGDGMCNGDEDSTRCAADCGCSAIDFATDRPAPTGCWCDASCERRGDCCDDAPG